jgi:hypothetical protein
VTPSARPCRTAGGSSSAALADWQRPAHSPVSKHVKLASR